MADAAIVVRGLEKTYPGRGGRPPTPALRGVDFAVESGTIFTILGPNGAGKTTLISILCGLLLPDRGEARVLGLDLVGRQAEVRAMVNVASGHANLPDNFTVEETLAYFGMLYGIPRRQRRRRAEEVVDFFALEEYRRVPFNQLSTGLKQRLVLAKALLNHPRILFLDEPTVGLDPQVTTAIRSRLLEWQQARGATIVLTTHQMDEAEQLSHRIAFLKDGRFVRLGDAAELKTSIPFQSQVVVRGEHLDLALPGLTHLRGVVAAAGGPEEISCTVDGHERRVHEIVAAVIRAGGRIDNIEIREPTLRDVFIALAKGTDQG